MVKWACTTVDSRMHRTSASSSLPLSCPSLGKDAVGGDGVLGALSVPAPNPTELGDNSKLISAIDDRFCSEATACQAIGVRGLPSSPAPSSAIKTRNIPAKSKRSRQGTTPPQPSSAPSSSSTRASSGHSSCCRIADIGSEGVAATMSALLLRTRRTSLPPCTPAARGRSSPWKGDACLEEAWRTQGWPCEGRYPWA